jgi:hypothetical protein
MSDPRIAVGASGLVTTETSRLILMLIFPNYPILEPCLPLPEWAKERPWRQ